MSPRIESVTQDLLRVADDARSAFGSLSAEQLNWKPRPKRWSVAQCFDHVINTHSLYFPIFEQLARGEYRATLWRRYSPLSGTFGRFLIRRLDPKNSKPISTTPKAYPSSSEIDSGIIGRYVEHQRQMVEQLEKFPANFDFGGTIITSPLLRVFTYSVDDYLTILVYHSQRHHLQAQKVTEEEDFPKKEVIREGV